MGEPTNFQRRMLEALRTSLNMQATAHDLAHRLKTSRLAVVSAGRALERNGLVTEFRPGCDAWASLRYAPTVKMREIWAGQGHG